MLAKVKFCGMTRPQDAALAAEIGASYVGVIFAAGPRKVSAEQAREILAAAGEGVAHVGVFDTNDADRVAEIADDVGLNVLQLHADPMPSDIEAIRRNFQGDIWAAIRIAGNHIPHEYDELFDLADGVLLDARSEKGLGGTGIALPWNDLAVDLARDRGGAAVILAGGLNPKNVANAIRTLAPDVVDVSSGIESSPGIKDPWLMREFYEAAVGHAVL
ncbi:MAG TPA: phosphoribosylanthranilate isomerase [Gemmatimonadaceae bacterium]|nr:phosphoribosylanthranilate isomerase [Gemmatimonadaceae bacterium]